MNFNLQDLQSRSNAKQMLNKQHLLLEPLKEELRNISKELGLQKKQFLDFVNSEHFINAIEQEYHE